MRVFLTSYDNDWQMCDSDSDSGRGFFFYSAVVFQGNDESAILTADEVLMKSSLSSLTQGYGSILLSTLFLFHNKLLPLSLFSNLNLKQLCCRHSSQLVEDHHPLFHLVLFIFLPLVHLTCAIHCRRLFCLALFSRFHTISTVMKLSGRSCCNVGFPATCWWGNWVFFDSRFFCFLKTTFNAAVVYMLWPLGGSTKTSALILPYKVFVLFCFVVNIYDGRESSRY